MSTRMLRFTRLRNRHLIGLAQRIFRGLSCYWQVLSTDRSVSEAFRAGLFDRVDYSSPVSKLWELTTPLLLPMVIHWFAFTEPISSFVPSGQLTLSFPVVSFPIPK